jgi:hypothetical protein
MTPEEIQEALAEIRHHHHAESQYCYSAARILEEEFPESETVSKTRKTIRAKAARHKRFARAIETHLESMKSNPST